jgi:hypothetical protein
MEEWRIITKFPTYSVSNYGRVKNNTTGNILNGSIKATGYVEICLNRKYVRVHKLVVEAFLPNWHGHIQCDHINRIRHDNRVFNLRWITLSNNQKNRQKFGSSSKYIGVCMYGDRWQVRTSINGKRIYIGGYADEKTAGIAYNEFIIEHKLEKYSPLNIIE